MQDDFADFTTPAQRNQMLVTYLSRKGGENPREFVYRSFDVLIDDKQLMLFTFYGTNVKKAFCKYLICSCIFHATKNLFKDTADEEIQAHLYARIDTAKTRTLRTESA